MSLVVSPFLLSKTLDKRGKVTHIKACTDLEQHID